MSSVWDKLDLWDFRERYRTVVQMQETSDKLESARYRISSMERALAYQDMEDDKREELEKELGEMKQILIENEEALKELNKATMKTPLVAILFLVVFFFPYLIYMVFTNPY